MCLLAVSVQQLKFFIPPHVSSPLKVKLEMSVLDFSQFPAEIKRKAPSQTTCVELLKEAISCWLELDIFKIHRY